MSETYVDLSKPITARLVVFFAPGSTFRSISVAASLPSEVVDRFQGKEPAVLSLPSDTPNSYPRLVLSGDDADLVISYERADFRMTVPGHPDRDQKIRSTMIRLVQNLHREHNLSLDRMAFVLKLPFNDNIDINRLLNTYVHRSKLRGSTGLVLSWSKRLSLGGQEVNQRIRLQYDGGLPNEERSITIDTNTPADEERNIDEHTADRLISAVQSLVKEDLASVIEWS